VPPWSPWALDAALDVALEQSSKHKVEDYKVYEETLQSYKDAKKEFYKIDEEHRSLRANFAEKLNIKNSFDELQTIPNVKINVIHKEILSIYEEMAKESDDFVKMVNKSVTCFQNLGTEFDESAILKRNSECLKKTETFKREINERKYLYEQKKNSKQESKHAEHIYNLKKTLSNFYEASAKFKLKLEIFESEQQLLLLNKNVDFLKQRNRDLQIQYDFFN
jgi:hypothetical protein